MRKILFSLVLASFFLVMQTGAVFALAAEETGFKMKTSKFFIFQETSDLASQAVLEKSFSVFVGEQSPVVKSAFIEIRGISGSGASSQSIDSKIKQQGDADYSNLITFTFSVPNTAQHFKIRYDVTSFMNSRITASGTYNFVHYVKNNGPAALSVVQSRLILTYQFTPPGGGYRASGYVISSTFDTTATDGSAPNTIMWLGEPDPLSAGMHVKFQFATSNSSEGPWTYVGPDDTVNTYYEPSAQGVPVKIKLSSGLHYNKRYFKYKVILNPSADSQQTPKIQDIILNWSP